jgi:hypothetical protein
VLELQFLSLPLGEIFFVDFPEAKFLDVIETKVFRVFLLAILSHLCLVISISIKLTQPLTVSKVQLQYTVKEKGGKPVRKPHHLPYGLRNLYGTETSSVRALKIMPRNLKEFVRS